MKLAICVLAGWIFATPALAISFDEARHLLARTGFGVPTPAEIDEILPLSYGQAVTHILKNIHKTPLTPVPDFTAHPGERSKVKKMGPEARRSYQKRVNNDRRELKQWWVTEMMVTPSPLTEHMTLFWHNHFVSEGRKVKFGQLIYDQNAIFRRHALGSFADMFREVSTGAAMLIYLDGSKNKVGKPNENFAREVLELFTLGEGKGYTEKDIREAARAFTGWAVDRKTGETVFYSKRHDQGRKTILGETGRFDGEDVLEIILRQDRVAEYIAEKLWREFVSQDLDPVEIKRLAAIFQKAKYRLKPLMRAILMSPKFRDPAIRGGLIKSPVDLVIGTLRLLRAHETPSIKIYYQHKRLGQDLFDPPDVKGWRGGVNWITSTTTLRRIDFLKMAHRATVVFGQTLDGGETMLKSQFGLANPSELIGREVMKKGYLKRLMLAVDPAFARSTKGRGHKLIRNLLLDPAYNLK